MSKKYSTSAVPGSPKWRARQGLGGGVLSPSRLAVNLNYRRQSNLEDGANANPSWFVLNPLVENNVYPPSALISPHQQQRSHSAPAATPFLTVALMKLNKLLPKFLQHLSKSTFESATEACTLFDSTIAPVSNNRNHNENSTARPASSSASEQNNNAAASSPTTSILSAASSLASSPSSPLVLLKWLTSSPVNSNESTPHSSRHSSPHPSSPSSSAQAIEGEWDNLVAAPFWLLAAAEVLWADLHHIEHSESVTKGLYQRCTQDFFRLQRLMCDPILASAQRRDEQTHARKNKNEADAARNVHGILETLVTLISCRCQCLELQSSLKSDALAPAAKGMGVILHRLEAHKPAAAAKPLYDVFLEQLRAWKFALEACVAVEQCLFLESIVLLRQWKNHLPVKADHKDVETRQSWWLRHAFQRVLSTLPLYLDRPRAFAGPLYGLSSIKPEGHLETLVLDFLRRQAKLSGPPTAVAIILDAAGASNLYPERGFRLSADDAAAATADDTDIRTLWPAVYMRSTMHSISPGGPHRSVSNASSMGSGLLTRSVSSGNATSSFSSSPSSRLASRKISTAGLNSSSSRSKEEEQVQQCTTLLEYGSDQGVATSWPHSDWEVMVDLLDRRLPSEGSGGMVAENIIQNKTGKLDENNADAKAGDDGVADNEGIVAATQVTPNYPHAATYRDASEDIIVEEHDVSVTAGEATSTGFFASPFPNTFPAGSNSSSPLESAHDNVKIQSTFHLISLSNWATMVVFVKKEESARWQRKRHQLSDEEIQNFLTEMAAKLRVSAPFTSQSHLPPSNIPKKEQGEPILTRALSSFQEKHGKPPWSNDDKVRILVSTVKEELGLRPMPQVALVPRSWWKGSSSTGREVIAGNENHTGPGLLRSLRQQASSASLSNSAAAFFLGPELCHLV